MNNLRRLLTGSLCFLFIYSLHSCNKDKFTLEDLPDYTQEGLHTLGCIANGHVFIPYAHPLNPNPRLTGNVGESDLNKGTYYVRIFANQLVSTDTTQYSTTYRLQIYAD